MGSEDEIGDLDEDQQELSLVDGLGGERPQGTAGIAVAMQVAHQLHRFLEG